VRSWCFLLWLLLWLIFAAVTRVMFLLSCNPRFRVLRRAGAAVEPPDKAPIKASNSTQPDGSDPPKDAAWTLVMPPEDQGVDGKAQGQEEDRKVQSQTPQSSSGVSLS